MTSVKLKVNFKMLFRFVTLNHGFCYTAEVRKLVEVSDAGRLQFVEPNSLSGRERLLSSHPVPLFACFSTPAFDQC